MLKLNLRKKAWFQLVEILITMALAAGLPVVAQNKQQIKFKRDQTTVSIEGVVEDQKYNDYVVRARRGQTMEIRLVSSITNWLLVSVKQAGNSLYSNEADSSSSWRGKLPADGEYTIRVGIKRAENGRGGTISYTLIVGVSDEDGQTSQAGSSAEQKKLVPVIYACQGKLGDQDASNVRLTARFLIGDPPRVMLEMEDDDWELTLSPSASGSRYTQNEMVFWIKGEEATFDNPDRNFSLKCRAKK